MASIDSLDTTGNAAGKVHALRPPGGAADLRTLWAAFRGAETPEAFAESWLALQCLWIPDVSRGVVLARQASDVLSTWATWPAGDVPGGALAKAAEKALVEGRALALELEPLPGRDALSRTCLAQPVAVNGEPWGVVVLELAPRPAAQLEQALRQLSWGAGWLELAALRARSGPAAAAEAAEVLQLVATPLEHEHFRAAATAFVTELASRFHCDRAAFGSVWRGRVRLQAVSHSALFSERANLVRALEAAMEEALDQECTVVHPPPAGDDAHITRCHAKLCESGREDEREATACSVPVAHGDRFCAVVTLERSGDRPFVASELRRIETAVSIAGPLLEVQRREDRWLPAKVLDATRELGTRLVGPRHVALKLGTGAAVLLVLALCVLHADYRVTADAILEARLLRAAVAPFDGFVAEAPARAGDRVAEGDLLATLDDREIRLERSRWASQLEQVTKQYRQAMAERNAAEVRIYSAQMEQARAQLSLVEDQLDKMVLRAPFAGIVVTGDLSQQLGAPVQRGQLLYEVAPLEEYRVALQVDERDVDEIAVGQRGSLIFSAFPAEPLAFTVLQITPVSTAGEGRNTFRVEASLDETPADLQPGMEGVGKIEIDRRRLIWIWTHDVVDWLRLTLWSWLP